MNGKDKTFFKMTVAGKAYTVNFFYDWADAENIAGSHHAVTTCVMIGAGGAFSGVAVCNPDDYHTFETGKRIALKRAAETLQAFLAFRYKKYQYIWTITGNPIVDEILRAYRLAFKTPDELREINDLQQNYAGIKPS